MGGYIIKGKFIYNEDMVNLVLQNIDYGSVWKNIRSVSKNIYLLSIKYQESKLIELANPILSLIYIYPEWVGWKLYELLVDRGIITIDFIRLTYNKIHWDKFGISGAANITIYDVIRSDPDSIVWWNISMNPSIKVSDMIKYNNLPWSYRHVSKNTSIRIEDVRNNLNKDWSYITLARNSSLSIEDLSTIMDLSTNNEWWYNENAAYKDIVKYNDVNVINSSYDLETIVSTFLLDENILQSYIDRYPDINAYNIYKQSITPNIIRNNPQIDWDRVRIDYSKFTVEEMMNIPIIYDINIERIFEHPDFTINDFFKYFDIDTFTYWHILSKSPWLTFDIVLKYKDDIHWNHIYLSQNPNVTVDILEDSDFSWIEWDYYYLSYYAQLNFVYIIRNINKPWDSRRLSYNKSLHIKL